MLTQPQVHQIQELVKQVEQTPDGCGEVVIVIRNHHPRLFIPAPHIVAVYLEDIGDQTRNNRGTKTPGE